MNSDWLASLTSLIIAYSHIPNAQDVLTRDGEVDISKDSGSVDKWIRYCARCFAQMEWWAEAAANQREIVDPFEESPGFVQSPGQRNAP
jgi:hypothetical protein